MNRALGAATILLGLLLVYLIVSGKLANFLAALTAPSMIQMGGGT